MCVCVDLSRLTGETWIHMRTNTDNIFSCCLFICDQNWKRGYDFIVGRIFLTMAFCKLSECDSSGTAKAICCRIQLRQSCARVNHLMDRGEYDV